MVADVDRIDSAAGHEVKSCSICGVPLTGPLHHVREMMLELGQIFPYAECAGCECLQLTSVPDDLARYYPPEYYSYHAPDPTGKDLDVDHFRRTIAFYFAGCGLNPGSRILDVGSGSGRFVDALARSGFRNCLGIDPYLPTGHTLSSGPMIRSAHLADLEPEWDVIVFNHSFEHFIDPLGALANVTRILSPAGVCVIRMPTVPCYAWREYGPHWAQIDAPRHIYVHSAKSLGVLAARAGLTHTETRYDSTGAQFWVSELFKKGIPLTMAKEALAEHLTDSKLREFEQAARDLNLARQGDQAAFYLRRRQA